ncbi:MAG: hypothetical protein AAB467_03875 [Patescibacteria group bacterium]
MSITNLFYYTYWFKVPVIATGFVYWTMLLILIGLLALGLAASLARKSFEEKSFGKLAQKINNLGVGMGLSGLVLFFFRQQSAPVLGWRIWFLVWGVSLIIWLAMIIRYYVKRVPAIKAEQSARHEKEKYLPSGK